MAEPLRTFLAVEFSSEIQSRIAKFLAELRGIPEKVKWVEPKNFHLTVKFLGPTPAEKMPEIREALRRAAGTVAPFAMSLEGVGGFPSLEKPRVIWIGVKEGTEALAALAKKVDEAVWPLGFPLEDRDFSPHATIGRPKDHVRPGVLASALAPHAKANFGQCQAKMLTWFRSTLTPEGPVYEVLEQIPLAAI